MSTSASCSDTQTRESSADCSGIASSCSRTRPSVRSIAVDLSRGSSSSSWRKSLVSLLHSGLPLNASHTVADGVSSRGKPLISPSAAGSTGALYDNIHHHTPGQRDFIAIDNPLKNRFDTLGPIGATPASNRSFCMFFTQSSLNADIDSLLAFSPRSQ